MRKGQAQRQTFVTVEGTTTDEKESQQTYPDESGSGQIKVYLIAVGKANGKLAQECPAFLCVYSSSF